MGEPLRHKSTTVQDPCSAGTQNTSCLVESIKKDKNHHKKIVYKG